ncbi:acyltransferase family protein [Aliarcobacter cryaerophilus]|uniref:acyltransferase family protein n=1 Tax=Aliarcobacter cryaerophilus TaxID=28198 RepID=UPI0021B48C60|nr:acyltransferase [Aliarcobacter cryaerophilus]MCT7468646.1 acyltransferase [Aliarcobacter cryaerophilus]
MKQNNFDILRLILAILVFFAHWNILTSQDISNQLFHLSGYAVHIFFIVSGFLIFWSFDADQNKKHFYIKRFFRIFPLYAFLIILQTLFFIGFSDGNTIEIIKYFIVNIFFLNFLAPAVGSTLSGLEVNAINGSLWTLKNEVVFYALVPLIFMLYKKYGVYFLWIVYFLSVFYMFGVSYFGIEKLLVQFPAQLRLFVVGIILYVLFDKFKDKNITLLAIGSLILIVLFQDFEYFKFSVYPLFLGVLVIYLVYFVKHIKIDFDFSYSLYILHFPVIQLALYFEINPTNPIISFVVLFAVILVLSYFSEKYIEKRFIKIGREIVKKDRSA